MLGCQRLHLLLVCHARWVNIIKERSGYFFAIILCRYGERLRYARHSRTAGNSQAQLIEAAPAGVLQGAVLLPRCVEETLF